MRFALSLGLLLACVFAPAAAWATPSCIPACVAPATCDPAVMKCFTAGALVINELDYDQASTDTAEFIELKNTAATAINLDGFQVQLMNGLTLPPAVYGTVTLPAQVLAAGDYFVICTNAANVPGCDLVMTPATNAIQNGGPDGVALLFGTGVVDALSYDGDLGTPYSEGTGTALKDKDTSFYSLGRWPDGADSNVNGTDFAFRCATPGVANSGFATHCYCGNSAVEGAQGEGCDDGNRVDGDGCSAECAVEAGYTCVTPGAPCAPVCAPACDHGTCVAPQTCDCASNWAGAVCDKCATGYFGATCDACPLCVHGTCREGLDGDGGCECEAGWMGALCTDLACDPVCEAPFVCNNGSRTCFIPGALTINELDYDQIISDNAEYIELHNKAAKTISTGGYSVVLVNGLNGGAAVYRTIVLPAQDILAGDFFVLCAKGGKVANCDLEIPQETNIIQNGAPDGVALYYGSLLVDALSYEGTLPAPFAEGSGLGLEDSDLLPALSISRVEDGKDTDQNNQDFAVRCGTPGAANSLYPGACLCGDGVVDSQFGENCDDGNRTDLDGCGQTCYVEDGWLCPTPNAACTPICDPTCVNGDCAAPQTCACDLGWAGDTCDAAICDPACGLHQTCTAPDTCTCDEGWSGADCLTPVCDPACVKGPCSAPDTCTCDLGWTGAVCDSCAAGHFGAACEACPSCVNGTCNEGLAGDGKCACKANWGEALCDDCVAGRFGAACDVCPACVNGLCNQGVAGDGLCACADGWAGRLCDTCAIGYYGPQCLPCPDCDQGVCGQTIGGDGRCYCQQGWAGELCDACAVGYFGPDCQRCAACVHGACNQTLTGNGKCYCEEGWAGALCNVCAPGYFGPTCAKCPDCLSGTCDDGLAGGGVCQCEQGWTGALCDLCAPDYFGADCQACPDCQQGLCAETIVGDGRCVCNGGWAGNLCDVCAAGRFGAQCEACPACAHGTCNEGLAGDGGCACAAGWAGGLCDACAKGFFGPDCQACPECVKGVCSETLTGDGQCYCQAGWTGDLCDACAPGRFGAQCEICPACVQGTCNEGISGDGACACAAGWAGELCADPVCDPTCVHGSCVAPQACQCETGWAGVVCDQTVCNPTCGANATCTEPGKCECNEGYSGDGFACTFVTECSFQEDWTDCGGGACFEGACEEIGANDRCVDAVELPVGLEISASLEGFHLWQPVPQNCVRAPGALRDAFYTFAAEAGHLYRLHLDPAEGVDLAVVLWSSCGEGACLGGQDVAGAGVPETVEVPPVELSGTVVLQVVEVGDQAGSQPGAFTLKVIDLYVPAPDVVEQDTDLTGPDAEAGEVVEVRDDNSGLDEVLFDGYSDDDTLNPDEDHKSGGSSGCNTTANGSGSAAALLLGLGLFLLWRRRRVA